MPDNLPGTFPAELRSLWSLCILSLVLGTLALGSGFWTILSAVLAMAGEGTFGAFRLTQAFAGWAAAVIGVRWLMSTGKILSGVGPVLREYQALEPGGTKAARKRTPDAKGLSAGAGVPENSTPVTGGSGEGETREGSPHGGRTLAAVSPAVIDGLILRMLAHYRENWKDWWKMRLISALGGWIFLCLGVLCFIGAYPAWEAGDALAGAIFAGSASIALGVVAILASSRFREHARAWERRLIDSARGEEIPGGP